MSERDEQLSLSTLWSREGPLPELRLERSKPEARVDLLDGPHVFRGELERALDGLDVPGVEATLAELTARFELPGWADELPRVLDFVRRLDALDARAQLEAARTAPSPEGPFARRARLAALRRALRSVLEQDGPAAELVEGRAVASLALQLGDAQLATELLRAACEAQPLRLDWWRELALNTVREEVALRAWCRVLLLEPERQEEALLGCRLASRLIDDADALELEHPMQWLPVMADLTRLVLLDDVVFAAPESHQVQRFARLLRRYRVDRLTLSEAERLERKRALLRARPELKELVRAL